jgi:hypothetical protein
MVTAGSSHLGIMRMASAIEVDWVRDLIPLLKDPIDIKRLSQTDDQRRS